MTKIRLLGDFAHSTRIAFVEFTQAEGAMAALNCSGALLGGSHGLRSPPRPAAKLLCRRPAAALQRSAPARLRFLHAHQNTALQAAVNLLDARGHALPPPGALPLRVSPSKTPVRGDESDDA